MDLGSLKKVKGANTTRKRVGRGEGSGLGVTAGRGNKGQHSRSGSKRRAWFEGGQMPLQRRLPKFGFTQHGRKVYQIVNLKDLERLEKTEEITPKVLAEAGLIKHADRPVKLLGDGQIEKKVTIQVHAVSKTAKETVEKQGGSVTLL
ncbi:MAG: 50S ribosomal protein L15 [Calditrichaeota bacterium]|nr:50S ribosomal protein L15 [Calditrichota bacterium]RQV92367.1 MAG: 50S ribosomal protein L15 [bacterium]RQV98711.1 MAG: 50S ribosomal protein L15 [Calditrichota bacterium]